MTPVFNGFGKRDKSDSGKTGNVLAAIDLAAGTVGNDASSSRPTLDILDAGKTNTKREAQARDANRCLASALRLV